MYDDDAADDGGTSKIVVEFGSVVRAVSGKDAHATRVDSQRADEEVGGCASDGVVFD